MKIKPDGWNSLEVFTIDNKEASNSWDRQNSEDVLKIVTCKKCKNGINEICYKRWIKSVCLQMEKGRPLKEGDKKGPLLGRGLTLPLSNKPWITRHRWQTLGPATVPFLNCLPICDTILAPTDSVPEMLTKGMAAQKAGQLGEWIWDQAEASSHLPIQQAHVGSKHIPSADLLTPSHFQSS